MNVVANKKVKTENGLAKISAQDLLELKFFINGILIANKSLSETVSWWITKNEKKLNRELDKIRIEDKGLDDLYVEKNEKGMYKLWDEVEGGFTCLLKEEADGKTSFVDNEGNKMPEIEKPMWFFVKEEKREEYKNLKKEFSEKPREIMLVKIARNLIENLNFPTMGSQSEGSIPRKLNRELFYDNLVISEDEE